VPRLKKVWVRRVTWLWPLGLLVGIGLVRALLTYNLWFNFADQATFFIFGRDLLHGLTIYNDFIHFRTPGFYFLSALFQWAFGSTLGTEQLLLSLESYVLYPLLLYLAAWLIIRRRWVTFMLGLIAACLPGVLQDRAGFALLAVAVYIRSLTETSVRRVPRLLFLCGLLVGVTFTFGQDSGIIASGVIGLCELRFNLRTLPRFVRRVRSLTLGIAVALVPLCAYVLIFSNVNNFLYYVFKYALVIQPKAMDLPFPALVPPTQENIMMYIPLVIVAAAFAVFYLSDDLSRINLPVLELATASLVTPLGRADEDHVIFMLPLILLLVPLAAASVGRMSITRGRLLAMFAWVAALMASFWVATTRSSFAISAAMLIFALASVRFRKRAVLQSPEWHPPSSVVPAVFSQDAVALTICSWALVLLPFVSDIYGFSWPLLKSGWSRDFGAQKGHSSHTISGVPVEGATYEDLNAVHRLIREYHATVLFSYPIQPFYYSLAPQQATRFVTFEFETTPTEESEAIADLKRSRPQLVIMDVLQAQAEEKDLGQLNAYVERNYRPVAEVDYLTPLTVLVPSSEGN
jgi:hypothetical protein